VNNPSSKRRTRRGSSRTATEHRDPAAGPDPVRDVRVDTVMFYPTPNSLTGCTVYYVNQPTTVFDDSDTPGLAPRELPPRDRGSRYRVRGGAVGAE
jgi:hypothetical protein